MKIRKQSLVLAVCMLLALAGCRGKIVIPVAELTKDGYFTLRESNEKGKYGPVVILPERHDSRLIQAQFTWALDMLRESCGINSIALEGMYAGETMSAEQIKGGSEIVNQSVSLALLEMGEIKAPEFMYLVKNSSVFGIEKESEYAVTISKEANQAYYTALFISIALDQGEDVFKQGWESYKKKEITFNTLLSLNPWTYETDEIINKSMSPTEVRDRLIELEEKTWDDMNKQTRADFQRFKDFHTTVYQRSLTMAGNVFQKLKKKNEGLAMIIGAAHTEDITAYFDENKVSYYVLEPSGLNAVDIWSNLTAKEYERKSTETSVFANKQIKEFFMGRRNSRPVVGKAWFKKEREMYYFLYEMSGWAFSDPPPDMANIPAGYGLRVIGDSIERLGPKDIMFTVENEKGNSINIRIAENRHNAGNVTLREALREMMVRLSQIDEESASQRQSIEAAGNLVVGCNLGSNSVFISINKDALRDIDINVYINIH